MKSRIHYLLRLATLVLIVLTAIAQETSPPPAKIRWHIAVLQQKLEWYAFSEARAIADSIFAERELVQ